LIAACVIDASIAIKWVITESDTEAANRLRWGDTEFHAPDLIIPETGNILWKKARRNELTKAEAELACGILRLAKIAIHAMGPHATSALEMAAALDHPVYDTTYLALAQTLNVPMVTADQRLLTKVAASRNLALPKLILLS
jgi:predicted nucleic acid-binding protein